MLLLALFWRDLLVVGCSIGIVVVLRAQRRPTWGTVEAWADWIMDNDPSDRADGHRSTPVPLRPVAALALRPTERLAFGRWLPCLRPNEASLSDALPAVSLDISEDDVAPFAHLYAGHCRCCAL